MLVGLTIDTLSLAIVLLLINMAGLVLTAYDKSKAKKRGWRVAEKWFFILAAVGGAWGIFMGMFLFRHKTKHISFLIGIPFLGILNMVLLKVFLAV